MNIILNKFFFKYKFPSLFFKQKKKMYPPPSYDNAKYSQGYADAMNIPPIQPYPPSSLGTGTRWSTGLCHCCDDPANCLITCFCPCVTFGQIAEIVNKGDICKFDFITTVIEGVVLVGS